MTAKFQQRSFIVLVVSFIMLLQLTAAQDVIESTENLQLLKLNGYSQTYYYSKGKEERAKAIATFLENGRAYFGKEIGFKPKARVFILAPRDWKKVSAKQLREVYGFPHNVNQGRLVIKNEKRNTLVIAAEDNQYWQSFLPPIENLPRPAAEEIEIAYSKPDGSFSMMPFFDLLALHELGHSYTAQAELKMQRYWMQELFVNIMLHTYVAEKHPELLPALEAFPNMVVGAGSAEYKFTSLKDFEQLYPIMGMGPKNYGWYQCRLHYAAKDIYNKAGKEVLKKLWIALKKHQKEMTDEEFISMLNKEVHPSVANVFMEWDKH